MAKKQKTTIDDIAEAAGVSIKTVSRVFNNVPSVRPQKRDMVLKIAAEMNYRPSIAARQLASNRSFIIAHFYDNPNTDYLSRIYDGMREACMDSGYYAVAQQLNFDGKNYRSTLLNFLRHHEVDGVILSPPVSDDLSVINEMRKRGITCALISPGHKRRDCINVFIDEKSAGEKITHHIINRGHENLAFISGLDSHTASRQREAGFWRAIEQAGLPCHCGHKIAGDFSMQSGVQAFDRLLEERPDITGIFAANDEMAVGIIIAALQAGRKIPDSLAVVGFDDSQFARAMWPSVTSVAQPVTDMAHLATKQLIGVLESKSSMKTNHKFVTEIHIRDSCP